MSNVLDRFVRFCICAAAALALATAPAEGASPDDTSSALGACCTVDGCVMTMGEDACSALGGFYFPGESCDAGWCDPGACCSETNCFTVDAFNCIANGRDYIGPGVSCAIDPCDIGFGACCLGETCDLLSAVECAAAGGVFLGPGTICGNDPCLAGSCCFEDGCFDGAQHECAARGGTFVAGAACADLPCTEPSLCPAGTLFGQSPDGPDDFIAGTSEASSNLERYEHFFAVGGAIEEVHWWGVDLQPLGGSLWAECDEFDPTFEISFHVDAGGVPGDAVCAFSLLATRTPTGVFYLGTELNEYHAVLPAPCVLTDGWVRIVGLGDPDCWFLWMSAGAGGSWCSLCLPSPQDFDLAVCLLGTAGGIFGACCDDATGECGDDVEITECLGPMQRFSPGGTCADLDPPCGVILGACCFEDATCDRMTESECATKGGSWLGPDTICASCPCLVPCPAGGKAEGEPVCADGYADVFNGGCLGEEFAVSPIALGDTICGTGGVFLVAGSFVGDTDWYEVVVDRFTTLTVSVAAEFRPQIFIAPGDAGCPAFAFAHDVALECDELVVTADVVPGVYWIIVGPWGATDSATCGAAYTLSVSGPIECPADFDGDGSVDGADLGTLLGQWGATGAIADLDGDGTVDGADLGFLLGEWGPC